MIASRLLRREIAGSAFPSRGSLGRRQPVEQKPLPPFQIAPSRFPPRHMLLHLLHIYDFFFIRNIGDAPPQLAVRIMHPLRLIPRYLGLSLTERLIHEEDTRQQ